MLDKTMLRSFTGWMRLGTAAARMNLAAAEVIWRRSAMMATGAMSAPEAARMMLEKPAAFAEAAQRAAMGAVRGDTATEVAHKALRPLASRAKANARRLRK